jgi:hypothetical protein
VFDVREIPRTGFVQALTDVQLLAAKRDAELESFAA